jgi:hypothetical protein
MSRFSVAALAATYALTIAGVAFAAPDVTASSGSADVPGAPAQAPSAAPADQPMAPLSKGSAAQAAKKKADSEVICKPDSGTGSRVGGLKICMTRKEWRERDD